MEVLESDPAIGMVGGLLCNPDGFEQPGPPLELDRFSGLIDEANRAIGRLDGVTSILPDTPLFLYIYVRKEALLSSQIEGTQSSLSDLLLFESDEAPITDVFHCPYHPEHGVGDYKKDSFDRKPNPGMLLRAAKKHGLNLQRSIMIGDKDSDMLAAKNAGVAVRCHYLTDSEREVVSDVATYKIHSLREGILLLS